MRMAAASSSTWRVLATGLVGVTAVLSPLVACRPPAVSVQAIRAPAPAVQATGPRLPARIRRLTNVELERTVGELVGAPETLADKLPPDVRQEGYTPNADQTAPSAWSMRLDTIVRDVARRAVSERLASLFPCGTAPSAGCIGAWVDAFGRRAWRRPLSADEHALLLASFDGASKAGGGSAASGVEAVLRAMLESPSLLYVTELGSPSASGTRVKLSPYEIASALAYTVRGGPPDAPLLAAADSGALVQADVREQQARRLLAQSDTRMHFRRFVLEWLEVDGLASTAKDIHLFPDYEDLKPRMLDETSAFVDEVMVFGGGSLRALLDARFASVDPTMARFYGLKTFGPRASLAGTRRGGVLQQASFLAAHAHEDGTSPVKRGDFVLRKMLCIRLPRPAEVGIDTVFPPPSLAKTTRERFSTHVADPACAGCHASIDPLGFAFERFDAVGAARTTDNGRAVDSSARALLGGKDISLRDSFELSEWLAQSPEAADCYLRQAFRYFTAQSDPKVESEIVALAHRLAPERQGNLFEALVAYVASDLFIEREVRP
jgi:hypothetical protein